MMISRRHIERQEICWIVQKLTEKFLPYNFLSGVEILKILQRDNLSSAVMLIASAIARLAK